MVELNRVERFNPIFEAHVFISLKVTGAKTGLLSNVDSRFLQDGIKRFILSLYSGGRYWP